jgi:hypothetical protein
MKELENIMETRYVLVANIDYNINTASGAQIAITWNWSLKCKRFGCDEQGPVLGPLELVPMGIFERPGIPTSGTTVPLIASIEDFTILVSHSCGIHEKSNIELTIAEWSIYQASVNKLYALPYWFQVSWCFCLRLYRKYIDFLSQKSFKRLLYTYSANKSTLSQS